MRQEQQVQQQQCVEHLNGRDAKYALLQSQLSPYPSAPGMSIRCSRTSACIYACLIFCILVCVACIVLAIVDVRRYNFGLYLSLVALVGIILSLAFCILTPEAHNYPQRLRQYCHNTFSGWKLPGRDEPAAIVQKSQTNNATASKEEIVALRNSLKRDEHIDFADEDDVTLELKKQLFPQTRKLDSAIGSTDDPESGVGGMPLPLYSCTMHQHETSQCTTSPQDVDVALATTVCLIHQCDKLCMTTPGELFTPRDILFTTLAPADCKIKQSRTYTGDHVLHNELVTLTSCSVNDGCVSSHLFRSKARSFGDFA